MGKRKVRVYIAASLDGYIAHSDGDIDWLGSVARPDGDYGDSLVSLLKEVAATNSATRLILAYPLRS